MSFAGIKFEQILSNLMIYKGLAHVAPTRRGFRPSDADDEPNNNNGGEREGGIFGADKKGKYEG